MKAGKSSLGIARLLLSTALVAPLAGCQSSDNPNGGTPVDPVLPLALTCPSDVRVSDATMLTQPVNYSQPSAAGGVQPVSITCSPASGTAFPVGATPVSCSGSDAATPARTAACNFTVIVTPAIAPVATLSATRFMAYGDSITAGEINDDDLGGRCDNAVTLLPGPMILIPELAYPAVTLRLMSARYTNQAFTMVNEGLRNNPTSDRARFLAALRAHRPQAVLFLQGVIDLGDSSAASIAANIDADIADAKAMGVSAFFLSTLTPVLGFSRGCFVDSVDVRAVNDRIRALAASRPGVYLVDSYAAFQGHDEYLRGDGLHPTALGQQVLAQTFFDVIRSRLETTTASAPLRTDSSATAGAAGRD